MRLTTLLAAQAAGSYDTDPLGHVVDRELFFKGEPYAITLHTGTMLVASLLLLATMLVLVRRIRTGPESMGVDRYVTRGSFAHMIEVICVYLREKIVRPQLGEATDRFIGFVWTLFFFILFNNVLGLLPLLDIQHLFGWAFLDDPHWGWIGGTATGNLAVTGALAIMVFIIIQYNGLREQGVGGWFRHLLGGAPAYLAPVMVPVELLSLIIKPGALAVRLFANMVAGHTLLATLLMFTAMGLAGLGAIGGGAISLVSIAASVAIMFLEIFVAFLQAFIFTFLTVIFIAQLMHHHDDEHAHEHEPDHAHGAPQAALAGAH